MQTLTYIIGKDRRSLVKDIQNFKIDFTGSDYNWVQARQYEDGLQQVFVNMKNEDGTPFDLTGCNYWFEGILPDGVHKILDAKHGIALDPVNGQFRFDMPKQAFAFAGSYVQAFFRIIKDGASVTTLEFDLEVLADKVISGLIPRDYLTPIEEILDAARADFKQHQDEMDAMVDEVKQNYETDISNLRSVIAKLATSAGALQAQIEANNIVTRQEFNDETAANQTNLLAELKAAFNAIGDGSPKGTYANLDALKAAYPNGATGVFLTKDDGHWHYYLDSEWQDGGLYQSAGNAADSITNAMLKGVANSKILDVDIDKVMDTFSNNSEAVPYNQEDGLTVSHDKLTFLKTASGDAGIKVKVELPHAPNANEPLRINFKYDTTATKFDLWVAKEDGSLISSIWNGQTTSSPVSTSALIEAPYYYVNKMSPTFYLLFVGHGDPITINVDQLRVNYNNDAKPLREVISDVQRLLQVTNNGNGLVNEMVNDNYLNQQNAGIWNGKLNIDSTDVDRLIYDAASATTVYEKKAVGDSGAFFSGHLPNPLAVAETLKVHAEYAVEAGDTLGQNVDLYLGDEHGSIVGKALASSTKSVDFQGLDGEVTLAQLNQAGLSQEFTLVLAAHDGVGNIHIRNVQANQSGLLLSGHDRAQRLANLQRATGNFSNLSTDSVSNNFASLSNATMWNNNGGDTLDRDYATGKLTYHKNGNNRNVGIMLPITMPRQNPDKLDLAIDLGFATANGNVGQWLTCWIVDHYGKLIKNLHTMSISNGIDSFAIAQQTLADNQLSPGFNLLLALSTDGTTGDFEVNHVAVNYDRAERGLTETLRDFHNVNQAPLNLEQLYARHQLTTWGSDGDDLKLSITDTTLSYQQTSSGNKDMGLRFIFNRAAYDPDLPLFLNLESLTSDVQIDVALWDDMGGYVAGIGGLTNSKGFTTQQVVIQPSDLDSWGITGGFYLSINSHVAGAMFKIRNVSLSNFAVNGSLGHALTTMQASLGPVKRITLGQDDDCSQTANWKPVATANLKLVTPNATASEDSLLTNLYATVVKAGRYGLLVGDIDQHSLLVNETTYQVDLKAGYNRLDLTNRQIVVKQGQQVFLDRTADANLYQDLGGHAYFDGLMQDDTLSTDTTYKGHVFHQAPNNVGFGYTLTTLGSGYLAQQNRDKIATLTGKLANLEANHESAQLTAPAGNQYRLTVHDDGSLHAVPKFASKVVFLGNSLTKEHGDIGMCASDQYHDYYYLTSQYILQHNPQATIADRQNVSGFEQNTDSAARAAFVDSAIMPLIATDTDLVIIQMIDNVNSDERLATFKADSIAMIKQIRAKAPDAQILWVGGWFADANKMTLLQAICDVTGAELVNIFDLGQNSANQGSMGLTRTGLDGTTWQITNPGEALHPGDVGMKLIAERIEAKLAY